MSIEHLFLPKLYFLDLEDALPGAILPLSETIFFNEEKITLLLPFKTEIFNYLNADDLIKNISIENLTNNIIKISLFYENIIYSHQYILDENYAIKYMPVLTIYPYFLATNWQEYYAFYYDGDYGEDTFFIEFSHFQEQKKFKALDDSGNYQINRFNQFPRHIICKIFNDEIIGLIILSQPPEFELRHSWQVGIDFGQEFSNIYIGVKNSLNYPFDLNKNLQLNITESRIATRLPALIENFVPNTFLPSEDPLPLYSVLTTKNASLEKERRIFDGRIYIPDPAEFDPEITWIHNNLSYTNKRETRLFLKNLIFLVSANSASNNIQKIEYSFSYPNNFSRQEQDQFLEEVWAKILEEIDLKTGVKQICPQRNDTKNYRSKNLALGYYWKYAEKEYLLKSVILNIDKYSTDICIWQRNEIIYQCSVSLGHYHLFPQVLEMNPRYAQQSIKEFINYYDWGSSSKKEIITQIYIALRHKQEEYLKKKRIYKNEDGYFQHLMTITAMGFTGLYYYVGLILKTLFLENKYTEPKIPRIYICGNYCELLNWFSPTGIYDKNNDLNKLFSFILSKSSEFQYEQEKTILSNKQKHEIAYGLVLGENNLIDNSKNIDKIPIAGENYLLEYENNQQIFRENKTWDSRFTLENNIIKFDISEITHLQNFFENFQVGLDSLKIQSIQPLPKSDSQEQKFIDNNKLWKEVKYHVENELLDIKNDAIKENIPFIMGLKSLLHVLGKRWTDSYKD